VRRLLAALKTARKRKRKSQGAVAVRLKITQGQVSKYENGVHKIPAVLILPWTRVVGLGMATTMRLMDEAETESSSPTDRGGNGHVGKH